MLALWGISVNNTASSLQWNKNQIRQDVVLAGGPMNRINQKSEKGKAALLVIVSLIVNAVVSPMLSATPLSNSASPEPKSSGQAAAFQLTIDNIMRGPGLVGYEPRAVRWSGDSRLVFFEWKQAGDAFDKD